MKLHEIAIRNFVLMPPSATIGEAVEQANESAVPYLLVEEDGQMFAAATMSSLADYQASRLISDCKREPAFPIPANTPVAEALKILEEKQFFVVLDEEKTPIGLLTRDAITNFLFQELASLNEKRKHYIFELIRTDKALKASRNSFRSIVEKNPDGIVITTMDGRVRFYNPRALAVLGHKEEEAVNLLTVTSFFGDEKFSPSMMKSGDTREISITRSAGGAGIGELRVAETEWEGESAFLLSIRDVTERRHAEQQMEKAYREAEDATRAKMEFLSNVSHEIRTPLAAICSSASNLLAGVGGDLNDVQKEYLSMIDEDAAKLHKLVSNLLDASRFSAGRIRLSYSAVSLALLAERAVEAYRPLIEQKNIDVKTDISSDAPMAHADGAMIEQVITNLLHNALKFTADKGSIVIKAEEHSENILVSVSDTGRGIASSDARRIFDRFVQVGKEAGPGSKGTGLGLSICKSIVSLHGGRIWVESKPGVGSTFFFTLPKVCTEIMFEQKIEAAIKSAADEEGTFSILLVSVNAISEGVDINVDAAELLHRIRTIMASYARSDASRYGWNRIGTVLQGAEELNRVKIVGQINETVAEFFRSTGKADLCEVTIGTAHYPENGASVAALIDWAVERSSAILTDVH